MSRAVLGLLLLGCKAPSVTSTDPAPTDAPTVVPTPDPTDPPTDTGDAPVQPAIDASATLQIGVPLVATGNVAGTWSLISTARTGFDCDAWLTVDGTQATVALTGATPAWCADTLELRLATADAAVSVALEVVATPGRVDTWTEVAGNPQPALAACPTWDCLNHADPTLGRLPTGELALWFAAGGDVADGMPVVGRAVQTASGWSVDAAPVLVPTDAGPSAWDTARETPSVRWNEDADAWDLWYLGYNVSYFDDPAIGQSRSTDPAGTDFPRPADPIYRPTAGAWDEHFLTSPGALQGSDGVWRLYYAGASFAIDGGFGKIGVLTSTDGQTWTPHATNPVFEGQPGAWDASVLDPHVQFVGGRYVLWYSALDGELQPDSPISVGVATSEDGFSWTRLGTTPVLGAAAGAWRDLRFLDVEVLVEADGSLLLTGYGLSSTSPVPEFPDFRPGRIGLFSSP